MKTQQVLLAAAVLLVAAAAPFAEAWAEGSWVTARATYYGRDAWSVDTGACGFGFICPDRWTDQLAEGYDVVAVSDKSNLFTGAQCGQCLEVQCTNGDFTDAFGNSFQRTGLCKNGAESMSVKVKIVDECPCYKPDNQRSNAEWCCGDMPHLDMSEWALEKLVDDATRWGVFSIRYRTIGCDATVANPAPNLSPIPADPHADEKPTSLDCSSQDPKVAGPSSGSSGRGAKSSSSSGGSGSLTTEAASSSRATVSTAALHASKYWPQTSVSGGTHSRKYYDRRAAYLNAAKEMHTWAYFEKLYAYFAKMSPDMQPINGRRLLGSPSQEA